MKEEKILSGHCRSEGITIYLIGTKREFIHLSFSRHRHEEAIKRLTLSGLNVVRRQTFAGFCLEFDEYIKGQRRTFSVQSGSLFSGRATPFQQRLWQLIKSIPYGETRTYGELAEKLGNPSAARSVGQACAANPLVLLVPCNRVVGSNNIGGFSGGVEIKRKLLAIEQGGKCSTAIQISNSFFVNK